jgi:hypothetical protein
VGGLLEQPTPVLQNHHGIDPRCRDPLVGLDGDDPLRPSGSGLRVTPLPPGLALIQLPVELIEELVDFVENELRRRRDLSRAIHGVGIRESMALIPIVSNPMD